jgi:hypothetical protein
MSLLDAVDRNNRFLQIKNKSSAIEDFGDEGICSSSAIATSQRSEPFPNHLISRSGINFIEAGTGILLCRGPEEIVLEITYVKSVNEIEA